MDFNLVENEVIIDKFDYKNEKRKDVVFSESELFITNKRVVLVETKNDNVARREVMVDQIVGVKTSFNYNNNERKKHVLFGIILAVLGLVIAGAPFALFYLLKMNILEPYKYYAIGLGALLVVVAIILLTRSKGSCYKRLQFTFQSNRPFVSVLEDDVKSLSAIKSMTSKRKKKKEEDLEVVVDVIPEEAYNLVNKVGDAILKAKASN